MTSSPTFPPPPFSSRKEPFPYQYSGERETRSNFCITDASVPNERARGQVSVALPPIINFQFSGVPLLYGHVCQTPFAAAAAVFVPRGEGRLKVQVRRKTNVFIAGLFSFPKSGKTGPFHHWPFIKLLPKSSSRSFALQPTRDNSSLFSSAWM